MEDDRGSIAFFSSYRPPVPLDIFSRSATSTQDEQCLTDGNSYNYNGQIIPAKSLKALIQNPKLASKGTVADVDSGRLTGMVFVSERDSSGGLETLHISLSLGGHVEVFHFSDVFGTFNGVRMEDSGCFAGEYLVYVSTMEPAPRRRQPWTAVYKTNLRTGITDRLTPEGQADLNPSVSPSGRRVAVASFQRKGGWKGEIEDLKTSIFVMDLMNPRDRKVAVRLGGWPSWATEDILFFHRKENDFWGVFRADLGGGRLPVLVTPRVTPAGIDAVTPAAIDSITVAVATIRQKSEITGKVMERVPAQYRHIEIFNMMNPQNPIQLTLTTRPRTDHFNPFVIDAGKRIGYHRCHISDHLKSGGDIEKKYHSLKSPHKDIAVIRVPGVFPTFTNDGSRLAFVDNEFKAVWVADEKGLRVVYNAEGPDRVFSPVWNKNNDLDTLYVCVGPSFKPDQELNIHAITDISGGNNDRIQLTKCFNNAFPSTNPDGTKLVFRSTKDGGDKKYKSLYIMEDAESGEYGGKITRLTDGPFTDTHCHWSPNGEWIVFASDRGKPPNAPEKDNNLDPGFFSVYLVKWNDSKVLVRVTGSANDLSGHVNHPFFSPDGRTIVVTSDLAAVSVDPMSLPLFVHSVRPYGDIFTVEIDPVNIDKNKDLNNFIRITHSRYENSTATWTRSSTHDPHAKWNLFLTHDYTPYCPYLHGDDHESWHMTGHLCIPTNCG